MSCPAASRPPRRPGPRALDYDADSAILRPTARAFTGASLLGRGGNHDSQGTEACATGNVADLVRPGCHEPGVKRIHRGQTSMSVEPTEIEELRGPVLGSSTHTGWATPSTPRKLHLKTAPASFSTSDRAVRLCLPSGGPHPFADVVRDGYVDGRRRGVDEGVFRHRRSVVASGNMGEGWTFAVTLSGRAPQSPSSRWAPTSTAVRRFPTWGKQMHCRQQDPTVCSVLCGLGRRYPATQRKTRTGLLERPAFTAPLSVQVVPSD